MTDPSPLMNVTCGHGDGHVTDDGRVPDGRRTGDGRMTDSRRTEREQVLCEVEGRRAYAGRVPDGCRTGDGRVTDG